MTFECCMLDTDNVKCRIQNPDIPRSGRSGRVGEPGGAARRGRARLGANRTIRPGNKMSIVPSKASKTRRFNVSREARTSEILCKPTEEANQRLTSGLSAGREALFVPGCRPVEQSLFVSVNPFHARHVRELFVPQRQCLQHARRATQPCACAVDTEPRHIAQVHCTTTFSHCAQSKCMGTLCRNRPQPRATKAA